MSGFDIFERSDPKNYLDTLFNLLGDLKLASQKEKKSDLEVK